MLLYNTLMSMVGDCERCLCRQSLLETLTTTRASQLLGLCPRTVTLVEVPAYVFRIANYLTGQVGTENSREFLWIGMFVDGVSWVSPYSDIFPV